MDKTAIISVKNVGRIFRSVKKEPGIRGALQLLLRPQYSEHVALKNVSFDIEPGTFTGLIGANGAGKTTLLKILSGLIRPTTGNAIVLGKDPFKRELSFRRQISLVMGQKAQLWWDLPALDAFDLLQAIFEIPPEKYRERLNSLAELLDVKKHLQTQIRRLSLGERMKMELIGALLHWPKVIFLDEPTIGLDVLAAHKLRSFLKVFNEKEKATIILTSHNMDDIEKLCSRVLILRSGELIYDGKPQGLTTQGECRLRVKLLENPSLEDVATKLSFPKEKLTFSDETVDATDEQKEIFLSVTQQQAAKVLEKIIQNYQIVNMGFEEQSLESVIQRIYQA
ncbi:MAG: ATP-binding cassette domain-containing protein [Bacteriovoracia bacterium]